jgi:hypothetical protein
MTGYSKTVLIIGFGKIERVREAMATGRAHGLI